jgi:hypothetical protein
LVGDAQLSQEFLMAERKKASSLWEAIQNVGTGLSEDIPRGVNWFLEQARKPEEEAQADTRKALGGVAKYLWNVPQRAFEASDRLANRTATPEDAGTMLEAAMLGTSGGLLGGTGPEAGMVLTAGQRAKRLPPRVWDESIPPPAPGHNMPPPEFALATEAPIAKPLSEIPAAIEAAPVPPPTWAEGLPRAKPAKRSTDIPSIRELPVDDAIAIARTQPHLIEAGDRSQGYYVGGPPDVQSKRGLTNRRKRFDDYVTADPRGGDWYDRYRAAMASVTGNIPSFNDWMAAQEGQWSAGVDPGSELHFALKENNASIAGMPVKAARPAQHEAHNEALRQKDWRLMQLGDKTGEYARLVNSDQPGPPGATGVNDFRHGENWGFPRKQGTAFTDAQHTFLDMETALAVDRANKNKLDGRDNWTGEQLQAAPWVRQKALDIQGRGGKKEDGSFKLSYEEAFARANKTIGDFFPRHTAFATYEAQPGAHIPGHMEASRDAGAGARREYFDDPASTWATAAGGRDAIYSGLGVEGTGNYMRVRPTQEMQGHYRTPEGNIEQNPGEVARPLVTFNTPKVVDKEFIGPQPFEPFKQITEHDKLILNAGEAVRGLIDAQQAGAWHKTWTGGPANQSNSLVFPRSGKSTPQEMQALQDKMSAWGLGDVVDTSSGITSTNFWPKPTGSKAFDQALRKNEFGNFGEPRRVRVDSDIVDFSDAWKEGVGSQAATKKMLEHVNATPQLRDAFNRNGDIAERAFAKMERDKDWEGRWGAPRVDIQNLRKIIGEGAGWVDRLEAAIKAGAILPAVGAAFWAAGMDGKGSKAREGST